MNPQHNQRIQALFQAAIELPSSDQAAFLRRQCAGDAELEQRVQQLLSAAAKPSSPFVKPLHFIDAHGDDTYLAPPPDAARHPNDDSDDDATAVGSTARGSADPLQLNNHADTDQLTLNPGTAIAQYEVIRELGRGGMGTVYLARDLKLGRRVAMKFLQGNQPSFTNRFIAEAQHTARCSHENIVVIHDVSAYQSNPFMVLEYLRGQTLRALMAKGPVSATRAVQLVIPVVRALACAHEQQIIHRDLKPGNIFITDSGTVKVLDFGIAKYIFEKRAASKDELSATPLGTLRQLPNLTRHGAIIGTLPYMSPEQWGADSVDFRTDIWAVGIMLYQLLVGKHPLHPLRAEQLMVTAILGQPMPSAHDAPGANIPPALGDIIDLCLQKQKTERMASAEALLEALQTLLPSHHSGPLSGNESPYTGLAAFQESDAGRFFGRSLDIATVYARLQDQPLIGVVGPSGVGKSSFVRAGIIPALKFSGETWESFVVRPGRQPLAALARLIATVRGDNSDEATWHADDLNHQYEFIRRLMHEPGYLGTLLRERARKHGRRIILFIDQFEELYTLTSDLQERLAFSNAIAAVADDATSPLRVILSIRSDFLDRVAEDRTFMAELHRGLYFLVQPDRAGLREAIVKPAEMAGYRFEAPWIIDHMLDRLEAATGALPLLQFAATKLWEQRDANHRLLTERSYRELGGVEGALATHANAVLSNLSPREQPLVRAILLQLVTPERTRAITPIAELRELWAESDVVQRLVDTLVDARLLVTTTGDRETGALVEIVHESLLHSWPMLSHWLDENQEDAPYLEQLKAAAKQWQERGRPAGLLWRGEAAKEAEAWSRRYRGLLPRLQREYLDQVIALKARTARRRRLLVAGTMVFLSLLVVAAGVGLVLIHEAEQAALQAFEDLKAETQAKEAAQGRVTVLQGEVGEKQRQVDMSREELAFANQELEATNAQLEGSLTQAQRAEAMARRAQVAAESARDKANAESKRAHQAERRARTAQKDAEKSRDEAQEAKDALAIELAAKQRKLQQAQERLQKLKRRVGEIRDVKLEE